jgi:hypothetical protein
MTSESDSPSNSASGSTAGRPPPTIELTATELEHPAAPQDTAEPKADPAADAGPQTQDASAAATETQDPSGLKPAAKLRLHPLAHVISAAVGAVAATAVLVGLWLAGFTFARDVVNSQIAASETVGPNTANAEIAARLDKIEHAMQAPKSENSSVPPALGNRLAAVEMQAKMLGDSSVTLNHRIDDVAAAAQAAQQQAASAASAAEAAKSAGQAGIQKSDLEALTKRIAALESAVKTLTEQAAHPATGVDQAVRLSVAAQALHVAVESGVPYQAELKAVQALGAAPSATAPLEAFAATGVPRAEPLAHELAALVPALRQAAATSSGGTTILGKLKAEVQNLVDFTPAEPPPGSDPASVLTRIDIDADRGDIASAVKDLAALPDHLKSLAADWAKKAQARETALAAGRHIAAEALATLSKPAAQ